MGEDAQSGRGEDARHPRRAIGIFLLTAALGPPIGSFVVLGPVFASATKPFLSLTDFVSAIAGAAVLGYAFGVTRACLAGAWIAYRVWLSGRIGYLECAGAALAATLLGTVYVLALIGPDGWSMGLMLNGFLGVAAVAAALACRWIAGATGLLSR